MRGWVCVSLLAASSAHATVRGEDVQLLGTTVPGQTAHLEGRIDLTAPGTLVFRTSGKPDLAMPYDKVFEFALTSEDTFHLGFFPAMVYGMVAPRPTRHVFAVSWHDVDGRAQEATFAVSKGMSELLLPVMYARARGACVRREFGACTPVVPPPPPARVPLTVAPTAANP